MPFFFKKPAMGPFVSAVVAAAGAASRMEGLDKQQLLLRDIPVVARSIGCLEQCGRIAEIVVVCREECIAQLYDLVRFYAFAKVTSVIAGGAQRQESVFAGIEACDASAEYYAIHDGARPLTLPEDIERCLDLSIERGAAALGVPVTDTIKVCDAEGKILSTPRRETLWAVQTPQIFEAKLYRRAMAAARYDKREYTDDCQLVENAGHPVFISPACYGNIKITMPEDIAIAHAILAHREGEGQWQI